MRRRKRFSDANFCSDYFDVSDKARDWCHFWHSRVCEGFPVYLSRSYIETMEQLFLRYAVYE